MKRKLRSIWRGITNLWKWRKVIYKDRDYDHWFIYEILKTKLTHQAEHLSTYGHHESSQRDVERIELCLRLINKVQSEYYLDEALGEDFSREVIVKAINQHNKAKRILFKLLEANIEGWWD